MDIRSILALHVAMAYKEALRDLEHSPLSLVQLFDVAQIHSEFRSELFQLARTFDDQSTEDAFSPSLCQEMRDMLIRSQQFAASLIANSEEDLTEEFDDDDLTDEFDQAMQELDRDTDGDALNVARELAKYSHD